MSESARTCLFSCFLSQEEPKKAHDALKDSAWVEAMQEELLQSECLDTSQSSKGVIHRRNALIMMRSLLLWQGWNRDFEEVQVIGQLSWSSDINFSELLLLDLISATYRVNTALCFLMIEIRKFSLIQIEDLYPKLKIFC
ncbi:hypothetical protein Tco_1578785 [Tanacetum coccineum]